MNIFLSLLDDIISKFKESIKKPIVIIYNIYCLGIYLKYNNEILRSISKSKTSNDKINMIYFSFYFFYIFIK